MNAPALDGRILLTGGAGLIGSAILWFLNRLGHDNVLLADRLDTSEKWRNLVALSFFDYVDADELRARVLADHASLHDISCVFHLGACSDTGERDSAFLLDNNYGFTRDLAAWAVRRGVRMVYASSAATYGDGARGFQEAEPERLRPLNAYAYSKQLFDLHAGRRGWLDRLVGLKYFNVFGPNENHKGGMRSLVHKAYDQIKQSGRVRLFRSERPDYADGEQRRDFLYVKEAAELTVRLAASSAAGLINIGSGRAASWNELVDALFAALDRPRAVDYVDMPASLRDSYQYHTCADLKGLRAIGVEARSYALAEAVCDTVRNYLVPDRRLGDEATPSPPASCG